MSVTSSSQPAGLPPEVLALRQNEGANGRADFERTLTDSTKVEQEDDATPKKGGSITEKLRLKLFGKGGSSAGTKKISPATEAEHKHTATQQQQQQQQQQAVADWAEAQGPFEGPEKLLELWFADSVEDLLDAAPSSAAAPQRGNVGLKAVAQKDWEEMLDIVKCKVLSVIKSEEVDAYLLS
jgi:Adenosylmethionine decarboxylase